MCKQGPGGESVQYGEDGEAACLEGVWLVGLAVDVCRLCGKDVATGGTCAAGNHAHANDGANGRTNCNARPHLDAVSTGHADAVPHDGAGNRRNAGFRAV